MVKIKLLFLVILSALVLSSCSPDIYAYHEPSVYAVVKYGTEFRDDYGYYYYYNGQYHYPYKPGNVWIMQSFKRRVPPAVRPAPQPKRPTPPKPRARVYEKRNFGGRR